MHLRKMLQKHSPEILVGVGIAGMIASTVLAVKATPKALSLVEERKHETEAEQLAVIEVIRVSWTCYIPSTITGLFSILCLLGSQSINLRRNTALAAAYSFSESSLGEYRKKVVEAFGKRKERTLRESAAEEQIRKNPVTIHEVIVTGRGSTLCYDTISGRYFYSDIEKLRKAQSKLNLRISRGQNTYVSLNDVYSEIGLDEISIGYDLGWDVYRGTIEMEFSSHLTEEGVPCLVIGYSNPPTYAWL